VSQRHLGLREPIENLALCGRSAALVAPDSDDPSGAIRVISLNPTQCHGLLRRTTGIVALA
jgi:hypothetical protein